MEERDGKETKKTAAWKIGVAGIGILAIAGFVAVRLGLFAKLSSSGATGGASNTTPELKPNRDWASPTTDMELVWVPALKMWVGKFELTNVEYRKKNADHDSRDHKGHRLNGDRQPAVFVSFEDAKAYAEWLTQKDHERGKLPEGYAYRLPSEEEWMQFTQCGDGREYPWGNDWPPLSGQAGNYDDEVAFDSARIDGDYQDGSPVSCNVEKSWKNPWGLYGVGGNVWEATASDSSGVAFGSWRGASWFVSSPGTMRCDYRLSGVGSEQQRDYGFRLVLSRPAKR